MADVEVEAPLNFDALQGLTTDAYNQPTKDTKIFKDECMYCFNTPYFEGGLYVCLKTYCAFCPCHIADYAARTRSTAFVQVLSKKVPLEQHNEPEQKISRLAVGVEGGFGEKFDISDTYYFVIYPETAQRFPIDEKLGANLYAACNKVVITTSAERLEVLQNASNAWDGELKKATSYELQQLNNGKAIPYSNWMCEEPGCGLMENLWLNLTDGAIRCGRAQFISEGEKSKGNNHMKQYYDATGYSLVVKLGTIEQNGNADVFSYAEDDAVVDPNLRKHLAHFGLDIDCLEKTEKSTLELELDMNQKWEWSRIQEDGANLVNAYGPGMTGLINIGSSCYMNSVIQGLLLVPDFCERFGGARALETLHSLPPNDVFKDFNAQLARLVSSMMSGDYALPDGPHNGIKPTQFKRVAGANHPEFQTAKQQDAEEYVRYIIEKISSNTPAGTPDPTLAFKFNKEERLQDVNTGSVRYTNQEETILSLPVPKLAMHPLPDQENRFTAEFGSCLASVFEPETLGERYQKTMRFKTFPDFLLVQLQRFTIDESNFQQKKLDVDIQVPEQLDLAAFRGHGLQDGEVAMPENEEVVAVAPQPAVDENAVAQLEAMGFSRNASMKAVIETKNNGAEAAAEWLMSRLDDPTINDPPAAQVAGSGAGTSAHIDNESVATLEGFGFTRHEARYGLQKFNFDANRAAEWLFEHRDEVPQAAGEPAEAAPAAVAPRAVEMRDGNSTYQLVGFISHMGSSPHSGHYVAHLLRGDQWVLFNDEKVAYSQQPPKQLAYLYIYKRV